MSANRPKSINFLASYFFKIYIKCSQFLFLSVLLKMTKLNIVEIFRHFSFNQLELIKISTYFNLRN